MNNIKNFCIIAHIDHGKSTLADRFLELTHTVEARLMKAQVLDQMDLERERGITIKLQPVRMLYRASRTNADITRTDAEGLLYEDLSYKVRGAVFTVKKQLGLGHKEIIYQKALEEEFTRLNLNFSKEKIIDITYNDKKIGTYRPDFVIEDKIILELKALPFIGKNEEKQAWTYLKGSNYKLLFLVNFAPLDVQIKRIVYDTARLSQRSSATSPRESAQVVLNLIDTPGHVDFSYEVSRSLAAVEGAILLVDATQGIQAQTLANYYQAQKQNLTIIPVINKIDLPNAEVEKTAEEISTLLKIDPKGILKASAKTGENVLAILDEVIKLVPAPRGDQAKPLRALVFDSIYDSYRGVVAYVRVVDGEIRKGDKIKFLATKVEDEALEVGYFKPKFSSSEAIKTGEIGYIVTGLKDVSQCRVGDTITHAESRRLNAESRGKNMDQRGQIPQKSASSLRQSAILEPLPGYQEPQPMVFASVYAADGEVNKLREAIGKLKLNDAALNFEPENSQAFGHGFRCGFLGLLHMEIFKERLEREYDLNLIITTPQVKYQHGSAGDTDPRQSASYEEPWVYLEIITPQQYIGPIMDYLNNVRGIYRETEYLGERTILKYEVPLASVVINFYDKLKSLSSGYASMSYNLIGYREEDLVKMDILVAGELVDILSQVVHRSQLVASAKNIVKRLKELIPRQMFQVSLQAAVGGTILAREDIPAMKKDVTGYLYGGDISRKKKLWAKQARGKKRMQKMGKVNIPTDVFIKLLKQ